MLGLGRTDCISYRTESRFYNKETRVKDVVGARPAGFKMDFHLAVIVNKTASIRFVSGYLTNFSYYDIGMVDIVCFQ